MNALDGYRARAPRLRLAALVVVGLVVAAVLVVALVSADPTVVAVVHPDGRVCATVEGRAWITEAPELPPAGDVTSVEGRWTVTGDEIAELTTASGRTIELRAQPGAAVPCELVIA